ncbi:MAG: TrmH family RNA methyltransferase [Rubricoccaceae bacterium]
MVTLPHPIVVVVHDIRSAYNVGSIFRTADSAGLAHVYLSGISAPADHRGVIKTALGAQDAVPWSRADDIHALLRQLAADGFTVAALERTDDAIDVSEIVSSQFPLALVLGNEVTGVPADVLAMSDLVIGIPQYGTKASLNVSVACGVAAYGLVAQLRSVG